MYEIIQFRRCKFQNCQFFRSNVGFLNSKNSRNLLIFQKLEYSKKCQFGIFKILQFGKFRKYPISEIPTFSNWDNSKILQFEKFQKIPIWKNPKTSMLENSKNFQIFKIVQFRKNSKFSES